jgi:hypothetical protein
MIDIGSAIYSTDNAGWNEGANDGGIEKGPKILFDRFSPFGQFLLNLRQFFVPEFMQSKGQSTFSLSQTVDGSFEDLANSGIAGFNRRGFGSRQRLNS